MNQWLNEWMRNKYTNTSSSSSVLYNADVYAKEYGFTLNPNIAKLSSLPMPHSIAPRWIGKLHSHKCTHTHNSIQYLSIRSANDEVGFVSKNCYLVKFRYEFSGQKRKIFSKTNFNGIDRGNRRRRKEDSKKRTLENYNSTWNRHSSYNVSGIIPMKWNQLEWLAHSMFGM